jgi:hypothetical protein
MRYRRCPICQTRFTPDRHGQKCCPDPDCAIALGRRMKEKEDRIKHRAALAAAKSPAKLRAEAQAEFNRYIKLRDIRLPCIACGRHHEGQWHAGHYLSVGAHPELRFDERNAYRCCQPCNTHLSGNLIEYRKGLILRYGQDLVDWLEGPHEAKHYTREDLVEIRKKYSEMCKKLLTEQSRT